MATHKVSELDGAMLDRAVAIALGWCECATPDRPHEGPLCWQFGPDSNFSSTFVVPTLPKMWNE